MSHRALSVTEWNALYDAAKALHGYYLSRRFREFLNVPLGDIRKWTDAGIMDRQGRPSEVFRKALGRINNDVIGVFDDFCGVYFYVLASHKKANYFLLQNEARKRVLYLRGYDFEGAFSVGAGIGGTIHTVDTMAFNTLLGERLARDFQFFKVQSSLELDREVVGVERFFYDGDYAEIIRRASTPIPAFYLNLRHWREDIAYLAQRMDYFVVYVSSITEGVIWELEHLKAQGYADRTTVVFDRAAITAKNLQAEHFNKLLAGGAGTLTWKPSLQHSTEEEIESFRKKLSEIFEVVPSEDFEKSIEAIKTRIQQANGPLSPGSRETYLDFRFQPALDDATLDTLRLLDADLWREIDPEGAEPIDCLPLRVNRILLRAYTALIFGAHQEAGKALATLAGVLDAMLEFLKAAGPSNKWVPTEKYFGELTTIEQLRDAATDTGLWFLSPKKINDFSPETVEVQAASSRIFLAAKKAAAAFLDTGLG